MADATVQAPEAPKSDNALSRIFGVLFSPKATFESIARRPTWLLPVLLLTVLSLGVLGIFGQRGGWPAYLQKQMAASSRFEQLPADQQQRALEQTLKFAPRFAYFEVVIVIFGAIVITSAILFGVFNGLSGTKLKFKTSLGIVAHASMTGLVSGILGIVIVSLKDPATIDLQNIVASNAGTFLSSDAPKWLAALLGSLDIFSLWNMILLAIGFTTAAPKQLTTAKSFAWVFIMWLVYVVVKVGLTAAFA